ncbi:MAG: Hsp20/alpha crystallin family protein [Paucibacter sp.]|nr:Hsp20/alpha crystallin family protein [Roseateles sp.]
MFVFPIAHRANHLSRHLDQLFDAKLDTVALSSPAIDVSETEAAYLVQLDLPGVAKDAVKVDIEGRRVTIDAQQPRETPAEGSKTLLRERAQTRFSRSFALAREINQAQSSAKLENGVLTLTLTKRVTEGTGTLTVA